MRRMLVACVAVVFSFAACLRAEEVKTTRVKLPLGVSVAVPKEWWSMRGNWVQLIGEGEGKIADFALPEIPKEGLGALLFQATKPPNSSYPMIYVTIAPAAMPEALLKGAAGVAMVKENGPIFQEAMKAPLAAKGVKVDSFSAVERVIIGGCHGLEYTYVISAPERTTAGQLRFDILMMIRGEKQLVITMAHPVAEDARWAEVMKKVRASVDCD